MKPQHYMVNKRSIIQTILLIFGLFILGFFIISSGIIENYQILFEISIPLLLIAVLLSLMTMLVKIYRWKYLSRSYGQEISWWESVMVFMPSLFYGNITPGKVGDLYKAYHMKKRYSMRYLDGMSMIFYERFIELLLLFLVAGAVVFIQLRGITLIALEIILFILILLIFFYYKSDVCIRVAQRVLVKLPITRKEGDLDISIKKMPFTQIMAVSLITFLSLLLEFLRIFVVALAFGYLLNPIVLSVFLCLSVLIGLVSQIPLGIGVMEGSLNFFISTMGVPMSISLAIVLVDRFISMYLALILGFIFSKFSMDALHEVSS